MTKNGTNEQATDEMNDKHFNRDDNCWLSANAERAAFLIDGEDYYRAVAEACEKAQRAIYILGRDVDSRARLRRGAGQEETFGQLTGRLARENPQLQIYILEWDFAVFYSLEREFWSQLSFGWMIHERVHFELDDTHPAGASHHWRRRFGPICSPATFPGRWSLLQLDHVLAEPQECLVRKSALRTPLLQEASDRVSLVAERCCS